MNSLEDRKLWPNLVPPVVATLGFASVFHGFRHKSMLQLGQALPKMSYAASFRQGLRVAPIVGGTVAFQSYLQKRLEYKDTLPVKLATSAAVGMVTSLPLAIMNGQTAGQTFMQSLRGFRPRQAAVISAQEGSFVFGLALSDTFKKVFGDNPVSGFAAPYFSGVTGSLIGHPANTALTRWQNGLSMEFKHAYKGGLVKAHWTGLFTLIFCKVLS